MTVKHPYTLPVGSTSDSDIGGARLIGLVIQDQRVPPAGYCNKEGSLNGGLVDGSIIIINIMKKRKIDCGITHLH